VLCGSSRTFFSDKRNFFGGLLRAEKEREPVFVANRVGDCAALDAANQEDLAATGGRHHAYHLDVLSGSDSNAVRAVQCEGSEVAVNRAFGRCDEHVSAHQFSGHKFVHARNISFQRDFLAGVVGRRRNFLWRCVGSCLCRGRHKKESQKTHATQGFQDWLHLSLHQISLLNSGPDTMRGNDGRFRTRSFHLVGHTFPAGR
jgi:hypothetical protein